MTGKHSVVDCKTNSNHSLFRKSTKCPNFVQRRDVQCDAGTDAECAAVARCDGRTGVCPQPIRPNGVDCDDGDMVRGFFFVAFVATTDTSQVHGRKHLSRRSVSWQVHVSLHRRQRMQRFQLVHKRKVQRRRLCVLSVGCRCAVCRLAAVDQQQMRRKQHLSRPSARRRNDRNSSEHVDADDFCGQRSTHFD